MTDTITHTEVEEAVDLKLIQSFMDGLKPVRSISVTEWAEMYRVVSSVSSAKGGPYRVSYTPYLRAIMDAMGVTQPYTKIVVMKGAQGGFSEAIYNLIGYVIDVAPAPMLIVMPTEDNMRKKSETSIGPMIMDSPVLRAKVGRARSRDSNNTKLSKSFPGGILNMVGANSPAALRSLAVKILLLDEPDGYPIDVGEEGNPTELAEARTRTFGDDAKVVYNSTPTIEETSIIYREFVKTDQNHYHLPCPHCCPNAKLITAADWRSMTPLAGYQKMEFAGLRWQPGKPKTVYYECVHCHEPIYDRHKNWMMARGRWIPDKPDMVNNDTIGFHWNSLMSPYAFGFSWAKIIAKWEEAQGDDAALKVFQNTILGLPVQIKGEAPDWEAIYERTRSSGLVEGVPVTGVKFITCGVDIQKDRIELSVVGWGKGKRRWLIEYAVIPGQTDQPEVWQKLALWPTKTYVREDGEVLPITMMCIDSGYNSQYVYDFCRKWPDNHVVPIRGQDDMKTIITRPSQVDVKMDGKKVGRIKLWNVGVSVLKQELYGYLKRTIDMETGEVPMGYVDFPAMDPQYFKGLCSEQLQLVKNNRGQIAYRWIKRTGQGYNRNEPLDTMNYARAAAAMLQIDRMEDNHYDALERKISKGNVKSAVQPSDVQRKPAKREVKDSIWKK